MKFKNIGLVSLLLLSSILLFSWCNKNKQQEPEENYFTAVIGENWILNVIDGWNSKLIKWAKIELDGENDYKIWDTVTIYFEWEIEDIDKINHKLVPWKLWIQVRTVSNWNVKDNFFTKRDNSLFEYRWNENSESEITSRDSICRAIDWSYDEKWYSYTYNDLWVRITLPECWSITFLNFNPKSAFKREWSTIYWMNPSKVFEYIKVYNKDAWISLEKIIKERHLNSWCDIVDYYISPAFRNQKGTAYTVVAKDPDNNIICFPDDEDSSSTSSNTYIQYFQPFDYPNKYYKLRYNSDCDGPCSVFWDVQSI